MRFPGGLTPLWHIVQNTGTALRPLKGFDADVGNAVPVSGWKAPFRPTIGLIFLEAVLRLEFLG